MKCLVTGAAGFVGSHLAERLSDLGHEVIGVDCFLDYYPRAIKERNVRAISDRANFRLVEQDVARHDLAPLLAGVDWVFHQAAQAGVRASWGSDFQIYAIHNVLGTQRLLEAPRTLRLRGRKVIEHRGRKERLRRTAPPRTKDPTRLSGDVVS